MGKTFRKMPGQYDEDRSDRRGKAPRHASGRKHGGMKVINNPLDDNDYFDDDVYIDDEITINKSSDDDS
jgi:hypothetical protein